MGHLTDYFIGVVRKQRGKWRAVGAAPSSVDLVAFSTRRGAIVALCKADDVSRINNAA
jgi:hypothetical protein